MGDTIKLQIEAILADKKFRAGVKRMTGDFTTAEKKSQGFFKSIKAGWLAIAGAVFIAVKAFKAFINISRDFEQSIANVVAVAAEGEK